MVLTRLSVCTVCSVGRLVVVLIAVATVVAVGKSSSIPSCSIRSNMLALFAIVSFNRLSDGVCCSVGRKISLLAWRVACLQLLMVALKCVSGRLCFLWMVANLWKSELCVTLCSTSLMGGLSDCSRCRVS